MPNIKIKSFDVENVHIYEEDYAVVNALCKIGKYVVFNKSQERHEHNPIGNLSSPYYIGEDREGAELMEFSGMDFVRTVKREVRKSPMEMFKELLEKLEGCLVKCISDANVTKLFYKDMSHNIGCRSTFDHLRPFMSIKMNGQEKYGIILRPSCDVQSLTLAIFLRDNEKMFNQIYNTLKGM